MNREAWHGHDDPGYGGRMRWIRILSIVLLAAAWGGCVEEPECPGGCVEVPEGEPVRLGVALALTGEVGDVGEQGARAVELALASRDGLAGFDVELLTEDSACTAAGGLSAMEVLEVRSGYVGTIGPSCSVAAEAILFEGAPLRPLVSPSNTSPLVTRPGVHMPGYFRVAPDDAEQAQRLAGYAVDTLGVQRAAVLWDSSAAMEAIGQEFGLELVEAGGQLVAFEQVGEELDPVVESLLEGPLDLVYMALPPWTAAAVAVRLRAEPQLVDVELAGLDQLDDPAYLEPAGAAAEGTLLTRFALDHAQAGYEGFVAAWEQRWEDSPTAPFHAHAWDATQLLFRGLDEVAEVDARGTLWIDRDGLLAALHAVDGLPALTGVLGCDERGDCAAPTPVDVRIVRDGETTPAPGP